LIIVKLSSKRVSRRRKKPSFPAWAGKEGDGRELSRRPDAKRKEWVQGSQEVKREGRP